MEQPPPITLARLSQQARARLNTIAADMGRTPDDLATAVVEQWTAHIINHLVKARKEPTGPKRPDFINSGVIAPIPRTKTDERTDL